MFEVSLASKWGKEGGKSSTVAISAFPASTRHKVSRKCRKWIKIALASNTWGGLCLLILVPAFLQCSPKVGGGTTNTLEEALWNPTGFRWWQVTQFLQLLFHTLTGSVASRQQGAAGVVLLPGSRRLLAAGRIRNELLRSHTWFVSEIRWEFLTRDLILLSGWLIDHYARSAAMSGFRFQVDCWIV
jgi:hypothetical protein